MSSPDIINFLTKKLHIEQTVVTFRSLSRQFGIHVNVAKNELATYYASSTPTAHATYLVTGAVKARREPLRMDIDACDEQAEVQEYVPQTKVLLVRDEDLSGVQSGFIHITSVHVYSLSPSKLIDSALICTPTHLVRSTDAEKGPEYASLVGKVVGDHVQISAGGKAKWVKPVASSSKITNVATSTASGAPSSSKRKDDSGEEVEKKGGDKKKAGVLDWSKAKSKDASRKEGIEQKDDPKQTKGTKNTRKEEPAKIKTEDVEMEEAPPQKKEELKRGTKRKSDVITATDGDNATSSKHLISAPSLNGARLKRGVILSDDEDDEDSIKVSKANGKVKPSDDESEAVKSLKAMMDIDDDQVVKVSRPVRKEEQEETEDEHEDPQIAPDVEMAIESDFETKQKPRKRKEKKVIPVGRNGLRKKRVVKSRTTVDAKGYMATEDYSSYESVDEEESMSTKSEKKDKKDKTQKPDDKSSLQGKKQGKSKLPETMAPPPEVNSNKLKRTTSVSSLGASSGRKMGVKAPPGQKGISSFFNKK